MNRIKAVLITALLFCPLSLGSPSFAQDAAQRDVGQLARRNIEAGKTISKAAQKAQKREILEGAHVSFEEVLKNPDDVELNFQFAKQQVAENDMLGAASTLERILIANPKLDQIRLFYLVVLFRLDNMTGAQQEIEILKTRSLTGDLQAELKRYEKEIKKRKRSTHLSISESVGMGLNTNRNASSSSKKNYFANTLIDVSPDSRAKRLNLSCSANFVLAENKSQRQVVDVHLERANLARHPHS